MAGNVHPGAMANLEEGRYKVFPWAYTGEGSDFVEIVRMEKEF